MGVEHSRSSAASSVGQRGDRVLTWDQVAALVPYSRQHLGRLEAAGEFPKRLQIGPGRVGWWESEVLGWLSARARGALRPWNPAGPRYGEPEAGGDHGRR